MSLTMSKSWAGLIQQLVTSVGSQNKLAQRLGVTPRAIKLWLEGSLPKQETIEKVAEILGVTVESLIGEYNLPDMSSYLSEIYHRNRPHSLRSPATDYGTGDIVYVPFLGMAGCGNKQAPIESRLFPFDRHYLKLMYGKSGGLAFVQVCGDSMHPTIVDGELLAVDTDDTSVRDGLFAIRDYEDLLVKRLKIRGRKVKVQSDNPHYQDQDFEVDLLEIDSTIKILGKVLFKRSRIV